MLEKIFEVKVAGAYPRRFARVLAPKNSVAYVEMLVSPTQTKKSLRQMLFNQTGGYQGLISDLSGSKLISIEISNKTFL